MEISILGIGNIGKLVAHSLARKPNPPLITLLLHRPDLANVFKQVGQSIEIITNGSSNKQSSFLTEIIANGPDDDLKAPRSKFIRNIIVATKANHAISALDSVKHRLDRQSTVLFTQNGMGKWGVSMSLAAENRLNRNADECPHVQASLKK
jgi:2-dehydropantoate 2-reductase